MMKHISHFRASGGVKAFDTETGSVSAVSNVPRNKTAFGSLLWKQNGKWFAFHNDDESLILQQDKNIWRVTPEYTVSLTGYFPFRNFRIRRNGRLVFSIWYKPKFLFLVLALLDPTYDALDAESDDFFLYLKEMWKSWGDKPFSEFNKERAIAPVNERVLSDGPEGGV